MSLVIAFSGIFFAVLLVMVRATRIPKPKSLRPVTPAWLAEMSVDRYRPMMRLLDPADLQFLAYQPGFQRPFIARVRKQRCDSFARYLASLTVDCQRALQLGQAVESKKAPSLRSFLNRTGRQFGRRLFFIRCRLPLYRRFGTGAIRSDRLVGLFEEVAAELHLASMPDQPQAFGFQMSTSHFQRPSSCLQ